MAIFSPRARAERTGVGIYEVVTFPFPNHSPMNYDPIFLPANPVYPDSYKPNYLADQIVSPDTSLGFGGGDIAPTDSLASFGKTVMAAVGIDSTTIGSAINGGKVVQGALA